MKNLKFRAWDKENNKMLVGYYPQALFYYVENNEQRFDVIQFTGLKDDDGKEIFQDDIVEIQNKNETKTPYRSKVHWNYDGAQVVAHPAHIKMGIGHSRKLSEFCDCGFGGKYNVSCKVVGNIYELPELLTNGA